MDDETTGLSPEQDRIVEVGVVVADVSKLSTSNPELQFDSFEAQVNPGVKIPAETSRIHGIYDKDVKNEESFKDIAQDLRDFIGARPLVGHNVSFDKDFLSTEFKRAGVKTLHRNRSYCTMWRFRADFPKQKSNLEAVAREFGKRRVKARHSALEDAFLAAHIAPAYHHMDKDGLKRGDPILDPKLSKPKMAGQQLNLLLTKRPEYLGGYGRLAVFCCCRSDFAHNEPSRNRTRKELSNEDPDENNKHDCRSSGIHNGRACKPRRNRDPKCSGDILGLFHQN